MDAAVCRCGAASQDSKPFPQLSRRAARQQTPRGAYRHSIEKARRRFPGAGCWVFCDDELMPVICPTSQILSGPFEKLFLFIRKSDPNHLHILRRPVPQRGGSRSKRGPMTGFAMRLEGGSH
jgi:hypothetical protein